MKPLRSYVKKVEAPNSAIVNIRVSPDVKRRFEELVKLNGWKKTDVLRGAIKKFIDDEEAKLPKPKRDKRQMSFLK